MRVRRRVPLPALGLRAPLLALALLLVAALGARALGLADINPLYFEGSGGFGFDPADAAALGLGPVFSALPGDDWIEAGNIARTLPIQIEQNLGTVHQNPRTPRLARPFIADSTWTVHNVTGRDLLAPLLVFSLVDPDGSYRDIPTGLDSDLLELLEYSSGGVDYLFGVMRLPDLGDGEFVDVDVRYVVAGRLERNGSNLVMPPLGLAALGTSTDSTPWASPTPVRSATEPARGWRSSTPPRRRPIRISRGCGCAPWPRVRPRCPPPTAA